MVTFSDSILQTFMVGIFCSAIATFIAAGAILYRYFVRHVDHLCDASTTPFARNVDSLDKLELLSCVELRDWLCGPHVGVSHEGADQLLKHNIDGSIISDLSAEDIVEIGVSKLGDRVRITRVMQKLQQGTQVVQPQSQMISSQVRPIIVESTTDNYQHFLRILKELNGIKQRLQSPELFEASQPEAKRLVGKIEDDFSGTIALVEQLPDSQKIDFDVALSTIAQLMKIAYKRVSTAPQRPIEVQEVEPVVTRVVASSAQPTDLGDQSEAESERLFAEASRLFETSLAVLKKLDSPTVPLALRRQMAAEIAEKVQLIEGLIPHLASPHRDQLQRMCENVKAAVAAAYAAGSTTRQRVEERPVSPVVKSTQDSAPKSKETAEGVAPVAPNVIHRVKMLFERIRTPNFLQVLLAQPPAQIRTTIDALKKELVSIQEAAASIEDEREKGAVTAISHGVHIILEQLEQISSQEMLTPGLGKSGCEGVQANAMSKTPAVTPKGERPHEPAKVKSANQAVNNDESVSGAVKKGSAAEELDESEKVKDITDNIKRVLAVIGSSAFELNKDAVVPELLLAMKEVIRMVGGIIDPTARQKLLALCGSVLQTLNPFTLGGSETEDAAAEDSPRQVTNKEVTQGASKADKAEKEDAENGVPSAEFAQIKEAFQSAYTLITGARFKLCPTESRIEVARKLQSVLDQQKDLIGEKITDSAERRTLLTIYEALTDYLNSTVADAAEAKEVSKDCSAEAKQEAPKASTDDKDINKDKNADEIFKETAESPSQEGEGVGIADIASRLKAVQETMTSAAFLSLDPSVRAQMAKSLLRSLDILSDAISKSPDTVESAKLLSLINVTQETLHEVVKASDTTSAEIIERRNKFAEELAKIQEDFEAERESIKTASQLTVHMQRLENFLSRADTDDLPWSSSEILVAAVSGLLSAMQQLQEEIENDADEGAAEQSSAARLVNSATENLKRSVEEGLLESVNDLQPYIEIAEEIESGDGFTFEEQSALLTLRKGILHAHEGLVHHKSEEKVEDAAQNDGRKPLEESEEPTDEEKNEESSSEEEEEKSSPECSARKTENECNSMNDEAIINRDSLKV